MPTKIATFHVTVEVRDQGEFDEAPLVGAIRDAIDDYLPILEGDATTEIVGGYAQHTGTMEITVEQDPTVETCNSYGDSLRKSGLWG